MQTSSSPSNGESPSRSYMRTFRTLSAEHRNEIKHEESRELLCRLRERQKIGDRLLGQIWPFWNFGPLSSAGPTISKNSKEAFCTVDQPNPGEIEPSFSISSPVEGKKNDTRFEKILIVNLFPHLRKTVCCASQDVAAAHRAAPLGRRRRVELWCGVGGRRHPGCAGGDRGGLGFRGRRKEEEGRPAQRSAPPGPAASRTHTPTPVLLPGCGASPTSKLIASGEQHLSLSLSLNISARLPPRWW